MHIVNCILLSCKLALYSAHLATHIAGQASASVISSALQSYAWYLGINISDTDCWKKWRDCTCWSKWHRLRLRLHWNQNPADKEVEMRNVTLYVSGCTETDTTEMLSPSIDGEYFKLCKILREFPGKLREYYRMNIKIFGCIFDSVKDDLQGYSIFRKCIEAEEKLTVTLRYALVTVVRIHINYICTMVNAIKILCNLKGNYTSSIKSYTKLQ